MKLLSYCRMGETSFGIGKKDGVIDLGLRLKNKLPDKTISNFLSIFDFKYEDFQLEDYDPHPHIKGKVAV